MEKIDLDQFTTVEELRALQQDIEVEIARRQKTDQERLYAQVRDTAARYGLSVEQFFQMPAKKSRARPTPRYRNPDNPKQTWSGRGKQPAWVQTALANGAALEELEVRHPEAATASRRDSRQPRAPSRTSREALPPRVGDRVRYQDRPAKVSDFDPEYLPKVHIRFDDTGELATVDYRKLVAEVP